MNIVLIIIAVCISSVFSKDTSVSDFGYFKMKYTHMSRMIVVANRFPANKIRSAMMEHLDINIPLCAKFELEENDSLYRVEYDFINNCNYAIFIIDKNTFEIVYDVITERQCPTSKFKYICQEHKMIRYNRKTSQLDTTYNN